MRGKIDVFTLKEILTICCMPEKYRELVTRAPVTEMNFHRYLGFCMTAGLIKRPARGLYEITDTGREVLDALRLLPGNHQKQ